MSYISERKRGGKERSTHTQCEREGKSGCGGSRVELQRSWKWLRARLRKRIFTSEFTWNPVYIDEITESQHRGPRYCCSISDRQTDRPTDRPTDRQTDRQVDGERCWNRLPKWGLIKCQVKYWLGSGLWNEGVEFIYERLLDRKNERQADVQGPNILTHNILAHICIPQPPLSKWNLQTYALASLFVWDKAVLWVDIVYCITPLTVWRNPPFPLRYELSV